jgi:hypothetical protein
MHNKLEKKSLNQENIQFVFGVFDVFAKTSKMPKTQRHRIVSLQREVHVSQRQWSSLKDDLCLSEMGFVFGKQVFDVFALDLMSLLWIFHLCNCEMNCIRLQ